MKGAVRKYWPQYEWSNVWAMVRNSQARPEICPDDCSGRLVVITGATSGIGYYTARKYAGRGANLLMINRDKEKSKSLCTSLRQEFGVPCDYILADLSRLDDMHRVGNALAALNETIDILIHNAGVYLGKRALSVDGIEMNFAVNYLASFVINYLVREKMRSQGRGRILLVNSEGYRFAIWGIRLDDLNWEKRRYTGLRAYGASKTAQLLAMMLFDEYFRGSGVTINAMHPGMVRTGMGGDSGPVYRLFKRHIIDRLSQSPEISAEALYYLGVSKNLDGISGKFFNLTTEEELAPPARDREVAEPLWEITLKIGRLR